MSALAAIEMETELLIGDPDILLTVLDDRTHLASPNAGHLHKGVAL